MPRNSIPLGPDQGVPGLPPQPTTPDHGVENKDQEYQPVYEKLRSAEELSRFLSEVGTKLTDEEKRGLGKLENTGHINDIKSSDFFIDRGVVYLPDHGEAYFVGDTHGEVQSIEETLKKTKLVERLQKDEDIYLVLMGDYGDRGKYQLENLETILNLYKAFGSRIIPMRGNHELKSTFCQDDPEVDPTKKRPSLKQQLEVEYAQDWHKLVNEYDALFEKMPHALITKKGLFTVHGGPAEGVDKISGLPRNKLTPIQYNQLLWNDPVDVDQGFAINSGRFAAGITPDKSIQTFGRQAVDTFCDDTGMKIILRAHENPGRNSDGFQSQPGGKVHTLFSAESGKNINVQFVQVDLSKDLSDPKAMEAKYIYSKDRDSGKIQIPPAEKGKALRFEKKEGKLSPEQKDALEIYEAWIKKAEGILSDAEIKLTSEQKTAVETLIGSIKTQAEGIKDGTIKETKLRLKPGDEQQLFKNIMDYKKE